jgi:hypothetical protein
MLSSLMPGLRELRTPLAVGHLWLANVWILLGAPLPKAQPTTGAISSVWTLGSYIGKPGVAAVIAFAAYLVGSFLEVSPLRLWEHGGRPRWVNRIRNLARQGPVLRRFVVFPISMQAESDLIAFSKDDFGFRGTSKRDGSRLMRQIMSEEGQIATRLQATNTELFGKYDRLLAESSFRINIPLPLTLLLIQVPLLVPIHGIWKTVLPLAGVAYGAILFRQGVKRAIQSRDVILQALIVGVVESRTLGRLRSGSGESEHEAPSECDKSLEAKDTNSPQPDQ